MLLRVANGFRSFMYAVKLAPDVWLAMFIRMVIKPEFQKFSFDVITALFVNFRQTVPDTLWVCISNLLHKLEKQHNPKVG